MRFTPHSTGLLKMHLAVLLFGFTAILGNLIELSAIMIVWWRVLITSISLLFFISFGKKLLLIKRKYLLRFCGIGVIIGLHWICFFGAVKWANSSVALICMATTALFTALIEPYINRTTISKLEVFTGAIIIPGMILLVSATSLELRWGFIPGILAAVFASLFAILNKKYIHEADYFSITFLELTSATIFISIMLPMLFLFSEDTQFFPPGLYDWIYLLVLALLCTTLAHVLALSALKEITAFNSNLIINLEPLYGILMAIFLLKEHQDLSSGFYLGSIIILIVIFVYSPLKKRWSL